MTPKSPQDTLVRSAADLTDLWVGLMTAEGFAIRSLWMIFIERGGRMAPMVSPIENIPVEPDDLLLRNLALVIRDLADGDDVLPAFLLSRPGSDRVLPGDRCWARGLMTTLGPQLSPWPIHLATVGRVRAIGPDDLVASSAT